MTTPKDDKITLALSGSIELEVEADTSSHSQDDIEAFDILKLEEAFEKLLGTGWVEDQLKQSVTPVYVVKSDKDKVWLFNASKKCFFQFDNMVEITAIGEKITEDKSYCYINNDIYEVDNELIHCLGWN